MFFIKCCLIFLVNKPCKEIEMLPSKSDHCSAATDTSQDGRELNQKFSVEKSELTDGLLFDSCANKSEQFSDKLDLHQPMFRFEIFFISFQFCKP